MARRGSDRDQQRQKVYDWERTIKPGVSHDIKYVGDVVTRVVRETRLPQGEELSLDECEHLVADVWAAYRPGRQIPRVHHGGGTRTATGSSWRINLPRWARHRVTVLHEIAHSLQPERPAHSKHFVRLEIELLVRWAGFNRSELVKSARAHRIKVAPASEVERPSVRTRAAKSLAKPRRCAKHTWLAIRTKSAHATRAGLTVVSVAKCTGCRKVIGE